MTRTAPRATAAGVAVLALLVLSGCRDDGRDMQTPRFPPPTPTTSTTVVSTTALPSG